eukprot:7028916-Lingulodinium_polyedra.AAC.1
MHLHCCAHAATPRCFDALMPQRVSAAAHQHISASMRLCIDAGFIHGRAQFPLVHRCIDVSMHPR